MDDFFSPRAPGVEQIQKKMQGPRIAVSRLGPTWAIHQNLMALLALVLQGLRAWITLGLRA
jgi:hypothetical protein